MLYIKKQNEPNQLIVEKQKGLRSYGELSSTTKLAIKDSLLQEQGYLCAYCMQRINIKDATIEHYVAQNTVNGEKDISLSISYGNMLAVCGGNVKTAKRKSELICDKHKGNIALKVNPLNAQSIQKICYKADGTIYSNDVDIQKDLNETLNLNCQAALLKQNRKKVLDSTKEIIYRQCSGNEIPKRKLEHMLEKLLEKEKGKYLPFCGIAVWYLKKKLLRY